jgi:hypothetical protein
MAPKTKSTVAVNAQAEPVKVEIQCKVETATNEAVAEVSKKIKVKVSKKTDANIPNVIEAPVEVQAPVEAQAPVEDQDQDHDQVMAVETQVSKKKTPVTKEDLIHRIRMCEEISQEVKDILLAGVPKEKRPVFEGQPEHKKDSYRFFCNAKENSELTTAGRSLKWKELKVNGGDKIYIEMAEKDAIRYNTELGEFLEKNPELRVHFPVKAEKKISSTSNEVHEHGFVNPSNPDQIWNAYPNKTESSKTKPQWVMKNGRSGQQVINDMLRAGKSI